MVRKLSHIPFESPPSTRRTDSSYPNVSGLLPNYVVGVDFEPLSFIFADSQIKLLEEHSPIVFCGPSASGKTSLAITLATRWSRLTNSKPLLLSTGVSFASDFQDAIEADDIDHFRRKHRRVRLLVIDDLDALSGKFAPQEELMATLDSFSDGNRPVIATLSRLPASIRGLRPGLVSRLMGGLTIPLSPPDTNVLVKIVEQLVETIDPSLQVEPFSQVLTKAGLSLSVPQLHQWVLFASQQRRLLGDLDIAPLRDFALALVTHTPPDLPSIAKAASRRFQVKLSELRGTTRAARVVRARGLAIVLARKLTSISLQQIGEYFGGRDHSTILHAVRKIEESLHADAELAVALHELQLELGPGSTSS